MFKWSPWLTGPDGSFIAPLVRHVCSVLPNLFFIPKTISCSQPRVFYCKVNSLVKSFHFHLIFPAFSGPLLCCYMSLLYRVSQDSAHRRIICFFQACPCALALICSLTLSPSPVSAWPVVAMPPHHTVIVWSLMAAMIRVHRLLGDLKYGIEASVLMLSEIT